MTQGSRLLVDRNPTSYWFRQVNKMKLWKKIVCGTLLCGALLLFNAGCDAANIVFASLDLAAAIVEAAS